MPPQLMGKLSSNAMRPYKAIPKGLDKLLGDNNYDKLVTGNALDLNQQSAITLIKVSGPVFFWRINQSHPNSRQFNFNPNPCLPPLTV